MEAAIQTNGLLSLPSNPQTRRFLPPKAFHRRFLAAKSVKFLSSSSSLPPNGPPRSPLPQNPDFLRHRRNLSPRRVDTSAAAADVPAFAGEPEKPKFLGVDVLTLKKIVPLGLMFFCILFNYTILRDTKDVLVVTAKGSSAEIIPFLKTWVNLPMAVGFMFLYARLSNVLSKEALFYTVIFPFIAFFGGFAFVLYPLKDAIHPTALADKLLAALGPSFLGPVAILRIWSFCLFYVMAELWGSVVISVLFWGFANQVIYLSRGCVLDWLLNCVEIINPIKAISCFFFPLVFSLKLCAADYGRLFENFDLVIFICFLKRIITFSWIVCVSQLG